MPPKKEGDKFSWLLIAFVAVLIVIGLFAFSRRREPARPFEEILPERKELSTEETLKRLSVPEANKPFKPDPEMLKKLSAPE